MYQAIDKNHSFYKKLRFMGLSIILVLSASTVGLSFWLSYRGLIPLGILIIYLSLISHYVSPPNKYVIEINFPGREAMAFVWDAGINFLWIPMIMKIASKVYCGDDVITLQIGMAEGDGGTGKVEFKDAAAAVIAQITIRVSDPIKATYETPAYRKSSIGIAEAEIRKKLGGQDLDEAMSESFKTEKSKDIFTHTNNAIQTWGATLVSPVQEISIIDFRLDSETDKTRKLKLDATKAAEATVIKAKADKTSVIMGKEAEAAGIIAVKTAEAKGIKLIKAAEGISEGKKITLLAKEIKLPVEKVTDYLLNLGMLKAIDGSTIIATSEGGLLNTPVGLAQTMLAINNTKAKKGDQT